MKTAIIKTDIWKSETMYSLNMDTKLLYFHLITSPERNTTRFFRCSDRMIAMYLGMTGDALKVCKAQLEDEGLLFFKDDWIAIGDDCYVQPTKGKLSQKLYEKDLQSVPEHILQYFKLLLDKSSGATPEYINKDNNINNNNNKNKDNNINNSDLELTLETDISKEKKPKKVDEYWEAFCEVLRYDSDEAVLQRGKLNKAIKDLKSIGVTPADIRRRAPLYEIIHPGWEFTASAIVSHWAGLTEENAKRKVMQAVAPQKFKQVARKEEADIEHDKWVAKMQAQGLLDEQGNPVERKELGA